MAAADAVTLDVRKLQMTDGLPLKDEQNKSFIQKWGFSLGDLYKIALRFFKEKEGNVLQLTYHDKLRLVAYTKQVAHGKFSDEAQSNVGFLDTVATDRSEDDPLEGQAWQALGDMSKETAMTEFIQYIDTKTPTFKSHVQDKKVEQEKMKRRDKKSDAAKKVDEEEKKARLEEEEVLRQEEIEKQRQDDREMQVRAALNQQTLKQFQQYVFEQYPYNPQLQDAMIAHLQEQNYQHYVANSLKNQTEHQAQQQEQLQKMRQEKRLALLGAINTFATPITNGVSASGDDGQVVTIPPAYEGQEEEEEAKKQDEDLWEAMKDIDISAAPSMPEIVPASMWTRKEIKEFKNSLKKSKENMIKVTSLATATVRVPTHKDGRTLHWEFATDSYDIGFGIFFEWTIKPGNKVSVAIVDNSDEEEEYIREEAAKQVAVNQNNDIEKAGITGSSKKPPTDEIVPVYRRDCHEEVYCGSHAYPGQGVYLIKFDNSYSLWHSKWVYYRVYYAK